MHESLPTGGALVRRILLLTAAYSTLAVAVICLYLSGLLRMEADQWRLFLTTVPGVLAILLPAMLIAHRNIFLCLQRCLDRRASGEASVDELRAGFAAVCDFPRYWFVWGIAWWAGGSAAVCVGMALRDPDFGAYPAALVIGATVSISFVTDMYYFFTVKALLGPVRTALAADLGDVAVREQLIRPIGLRTKLLVAMVSVILVTALYAGFLAHDRSRTAVERYALAAQGRALDALAEIPDFSLDTANARLAAVGSPITLRSASSLPVAELPGQTGSACSAKGCRSWRSLASGGARVVADTPVSALVLEGGMGLAFSGLVVFSTLVAIGAAFLFARDVGLGTAELQKGAARIASGDLRAAALFESEDEMGDLARAFEQMAEALRTTVGRVSLAAERLQAAAGEVTEASEDVAVATETQMRGTAEADQSMRDIDESLHGIVGSVAELDSQVDDASTSLLELDATGSELSESARYLSSSVDAVAGSVDETARSIVEMEESALGLVRVADDTSTGIDQTAGGMRTVGDAADDMSKLTERVIQLAETGHSRVRETIAGMGAIEVATRDAEGVIGELASSTDEIGGVIGVIDSVADETNLLALNAAIIAAQAGEHGRAFAVVAEQIRDLAARVSASTRSVAEIVRRVQLQSGGANEAIRRGGETVQQGLGLSRDAGESLEEIAETTRGSGPQIEAILDAVRQQNDAIAFVLGQMGRLRDGTGQISEAIQEQSRSAGRLRDASAKIGGISKQLSRAVEEQAHGTTGIRQNVESIREWVGRINAAIQDQATACRQVVAFLGELEGCGASNQSSVARLNQAAMGQQETAEELRQEIERFRL